MNSQLKQFTIFVFIEEHIYTCKICEVKFKKSEAHKQAVLGVPDEILTQRMEVFLDELLFYFNEEKYLGVDNLVECHTTEQFLISRSNCGHTSNMLSECRDTCHISVGFLTHRTFNIIPV